MAIKGDKSLENLIDFFDSLKRALIRRGYALRPRPPAPKSEKKTLSKPVKERQTEGLRQAAYEAHETLYSATSVFPFQLFPDTITIDRAKVSVAQRLFFRVAKIVSVHINDMLSIEADVGPFFGTVQLTSRFFLNNPQKITWLARRDAIKVQRILQGYIIAHQKKVDCSKIPKAELIRLLEDMGKGVSD